MTDNEIIVPLKCLVMNESDCRHCKLKDKNDKCQKFLYSDVLGLIDENNRQKAEIERLERNIEALTICKKDLPEKTAEAIKAEAIKEFAERLKEQLDDFYYSTDEDALLDADDAIDNLVKEMVGEADV